jgi:hypothetical protein
VIKNDTQIICSSECANFQRNLVNGRI